MVSARILHPTILMTARLRILHVTRNLPPLVGGMERLNCHIADELARRADTRVIGPRGAARLKPDRVEMKEVPLKPLPLFLLAMLAKTAWQALRWRPDVIVAGSGLTASIAWLAAWLCGARARSEERRVGKECIGWCVLRCQKNRVESG